MAEYVKIPKERIGVLIGEEGKTKAMLQDRCKVRISVTEDGGVTILSPEEDGLAEWKATDLVKAVGRGFNPHHAMALLKEDNILWVLNLYDLLRHKDADVKRVKARIIGEEGKAWRTLEALTNTKMSVYGRTVAVIGQEDDVEMMRKGIQMIIDGAQHPTVYRILEREAGKRQGL
jgi:ribosomal RNA assembly protein